MNNYLFLKILITGINLKKINIKNSIDPNKPMSVPEA
jgi:hypothetical protein